MLKKTLIALLATCFVGVTGCAVDVDGAEDEEASESDEAPLLAGRRVPVREIADHLRAVGFPEEVVPQMVCTAKWESSYYERASNKNRNGSGDYGLFQINDVHLGSPGCPSKASSLNTARINARCAHAVWKKQGLRAWYGYRAHRSECDNFELPE